MVDGYGHHGGFEGGKGGHGNGFTACGLDVIVHQLIGRESFTLFDLRNHFVGAAGHAEIVDIAAAEHGSHRSADILHRQSHLRQFVAVHLQHGLRLVDFEIGIHVHEHIRWLAPFPEMPAKLHRAGQRNRSCR